MNLKHKNEFEEARKKAFCRLMFEGKVSKAMKFIDSESNITGVHEVSDSVVNQLKEKHPDAKPMDTQCVVSTDHIKVESVIFEAIDVELIQKIAKEMSGSGGPTHIDAGNWKHILCCNNFKAVSSNLCEAIAVLKFYFLTRRLCTEDIDHSYIKYLMACRLIPSSKMKSKSGPLGLEKCYGE